MYQHISKQSDKSKRYRLLPIYGDCLEKSGLVIPNGAYAVVDCCVPDDLCVGDYVICNKIAGGIFPCCKMITHVGKKITVGTAYMDESKDYSFEPEEILGVVTEVYDKLWNFRIYSRKERLKMRNIKCKNCINLNKDWCNKISDSPDPDIRRDCKSYKTKTNADYIRSLTDDELAAKLCSVFCRPCDRCPIEFFCNKSHSDTCVDTWLEWLQQGVK